MEEDTEVPEGEEDDTDVVDEPIPRMRCACGAALASHHAVALVKEAKNQEMRDKMAIKRAAQKAAAPTPEVVEAEAKPKRNRGGNRKKEDPYALMCSPCRLKAQAGQSTDAEDEKRLREMHSIFHPKQASALAEQRRQGRNR